MLLAVIIFGVLAAACLGTCGYLYFEYARSPQKVWRERVLRQLKRARALAVAEKTKVRRLAEQQAAEEHAAHDEAIAKLLRSISVDQLDAYPGIGPGTIGKLRSYGITDLARLRDMRIHIPGLGEKRIGDIATAANELAGQSLRQFESATSPEGKRHRATVAAMRAEFEAARRQADAHSKAAGGVVRELEQLAPLAARVNVIRYHCLGGSVLVPADVMTRPLPDLDAALEAAKQVKPEAPSAPPPQPQRIQPKNDRPERKPVPADQPVARPTPATQTKPAAPPPAPPVDRRLVVMELTLEFAFAVSRADGAVAASERAIIDKQVEERYGQDSALLNRARAFCAHFSAAAIDVSQCLERIAKTFEPAEQVELIHFAAPLASAGAEKARALLERAAGQLGVPVPALAPKPPTRADHLAALDISPATPLSAELIRRQYHLLTDRFQPDKVQTLGPEFVALAEQKRAAAEAAALALLGPLGEPLEPPAPAPQELRHNPDLDDVFGV